MKRLLLLLSLLFLLTAPAYSLSDAEYLRMRKSSADFARADKRLNQVWAGLRKSLPKKVFTQLDKLQREWITSGRDDEAAALMEDGYSRMEAYTMATNDRADSLPKIAESLRPSAKAAKTQTSTERPKPQPKPARTPAQEPAPVPEPDPIPEPEPEPEAPAILRASDVEGEYQNDSGFATVRIVDRSSDEVQVTFSRFKDGVHWTAKGWLDGNTLELSDPNYSECQATLTFSAGRVKVDIADTDDWNEAISPDFVLKGTYRKLAN
ncbi:MAG: DUF1311 domain-containing protein [Synergistaceae bacterium]|nr:DUF1311 domain-containing protein [Synergistaceae bacterium]